LAIWGNGIRWNETKHVELEQFWHAFTSRGFDSVSWAFLLLSVINREYVLWGYNIDRSLRSSGWPNQKKHKTTKIKIWMSKIGILKYYWDIYKKDFVRVCSAGEVRPPAEAATTTNEGSTALASWQHARRWPRSWSTRRRWWSRGRWRTRWSWPGRRPWLWLNNRRKRVVISVCSRSIAGEILYHL